MLNDRPSGPRRRLAVVLFNLGGPDSPRAVRPFLFNLFRDPAIIGLPGPARMALATLISGVRARSARANYARIGGASPLLRETAAQAAALKADLVAAYPDAELEVFVAMRYWKPFVEQTAKAVKAFAPDDVVLLPLYPQFSGTTTGSSLQAWTKSYSGPGTVRAVCCYPDEEGLIEAHAHMIQGVMSRAGRLPAVRILFSAHGLPEKAIKEGDPYQWQIERTCAAIVERIGGAWAHELDWKICYQSRVGPMKWLGPSTPAAIEEAAHEGLGVVVAPVAFVSEHVETLVELDHDYALLAEQVGCPLYLRVPALGIEPCFIRGLAKMVGDVLGKPAGIDSGCGGRICPGGFAKCPLPPVEDAA
ncbi:MAG TPA: ferrochelatase [Caulobacteraceae bacterium]|jgi:ferrochelatase|nr:ferrochelatase [Caulobacteraceae bacterium]